MFKKLLIGLLIVIFLAGIIPVSAAPIQNDHIIVDGTMYLPGDEIIEKRTESSKTVYQGNGRYILEISIGAIHYKNDYSNPNEQWKDIDITWEGNRITKAPYELTHEGNKLTLMDKKTGNITTIELLDIGGKQIPEVVWERSEGLARAPGITAIDTDLEVIAEFSAVRLRRILKSDKAPWEARFRITGDTSLISVRASDADGEIAVESSLIDGILTETLKPDRVVKYPVRIDPTWQVGANTDDAHRRLTSSSWNVDTNYGLIAGADGVDDYQVGAGMRFLNVTIPQGSIIDVAYLTLRSRYNQAVTVVNTRISAEDVDDAATFSTVGDFDTRWAARTTARVDWDAIPSWTQNTDYDSPEIKTVIQEIVDRVGWASGNDMVIFWEDFEDRSTHVIFAHRQVISYFNSTTYAPKLVVTTIVAPTVTTQAVSDIEATTAIGNGNITDTGDENVDYRGIAWDTSNRSDPGSSSPAASAYSDYNSEGPGSYGTGAFTRGLTGLTPGATYYARAYAHNIADWNWGSEVTFYTKPSDPTGLADTGSTNNSISLSWTKGTGSEKTMIRYRTDTYPTDIANGTQGYYDTGTATTIGTLSAGQIYYFRAWAWDTNAGYSDGYSQNITYTLPGDPSALSATTASDIQIDLTWTKGTGGDKTMIRRAEGAYPANPAAGDQVYFDTGISYSDAGRTPNTLYYYRAWAYDSDSTDYSSGYSSDTAKTSGPPHMTTSAATGVEETTATLNGEMTAINGANASVRGFEWDIDSGAPYANDWSEAGSFGVESFNRAINSLTKGELYYYRAYATNTYGTGYGSEDIFLTKPDEPNTLVATPNGTQVDFTWVKGTGAQKTYIRGKDGSYPTDRADGYLVYNDTGTAASDTGLTGGHTYYYKVWSYATEGGEEQYSDNYDFAYGTPGLSVELWFQPITIIISTGFAGTADAGSSDVKIIDAELTQADNYWNGARLIIITTTDTFAPQGETAVITDFLAGTDELQFAALTAGVDAGDTYTIYFGTLPDREGNAQDGRITWGVNPGGVIVALGGLVSAAQPVPGLVVEDETIDILPAVGVSDWFDEPDVSGVLLANPLRPFVTLMSDTTTITELQAWRVLALAFILWVTVTAIVLVRSHLLIAGIATGAAVGLAVSWTIFPLWALVFTIMAVVGGLVSERSPSL